MISKQRYGMQIFAPGARVLTPTHRMAKLTRWREKLGRWDARYLHADGSLGEPVFLDPRKCTPT